MNKTVYSVFFIFFILSFSLASALPAVTFGPRNFTNVNSSQFWNNLASPEDIFLPNLGDVLDTMTPTDNQVLTFNATSGLWYSRIVTVSSTFNTTYASFSYNQTTAALSALNQTQCPAGNYSFGIYLNGTFMCRSDTSGSGGSADFTNVAYFNRSVSWGNNNITANWFFGKINVTRSFGLVSDGTIIANGESIAVEPTIIQRRVTDDCGDGGAITVINQDGTVTCNPFIESFTLGQGLQDLDDDDEITNGDILFVQNNSIFLHLNNLTGTLTNNISINPNARLFLNITTNPIYFNGTCTRLEGLTSSISIC